MATLSNSQAGLTKNQFKDWIETNMSDVLNYAESLFSDEALRVAVAGCVCADFTLTRLQNDTENPARLSGVEGDAAMYMLWKTESIAFGCVSRAHCLELRLRSKYRKTSNILSQRARKYFSQKVKEWMKQ